MFGANYIKLEIERDKLCLEKNNIEQERDKLCLEKNNIEQERETNCVWRKIT